MEPDETSRIILSYKLDTYSIYLIKLNNSTDTELVQFIAKQYQNKYNAKIKFNYPYCLKVFDQNNKLVCVCGIRYAKDEKLFLEQYLNDPIEKSISLDLNSNISRNSIVEIGGLSSIGLSGINILVFCLLHYLNEQHYKFISITAIKSLYRYFDKLGLSYRVLEKADINKLSNNNYNWGTYYQHNPLVIYGDINNAYIKLRDILKLNMEEKI